MNDRKRYLNPAQIERRYGIRRPTVRTWVRQGRIKGYKAGRLVLVPEEEIEARFERVDQGGDFLDD
jgi:excisionase family DNA binding protein